MTRKNLLKISDLSKEDIEKIIKQAFVYKQEKDKGFKHKHILDNKTVAMVFEKASLRTKVALETAIYQLGGHGVFLSSSQILQSGNNIKGRESVPDIARNLERMSDMVTARVYDHKALVEISNTINKPVINLLCDEHHPTQTLADIMAIKWHSPAMKNSIGGSKIKVVYVGDPNNVSNDLMVGCSLLGYDFTLACPDGVVVDGCVYKKALELSKESGCRVEVIHNPKEAVVKADFVYTDTFVSMGQESQYENKIKKFGGFSVDSNLLSLAKKDVKFMHCLPAHRGEEVTDEVMDGSASIVFDQAECRLHVMKALLWWYFS